MPLKVVPRNLAAQAQALCRRAFREGRLWADAVLRGMPGECGCFLRRRFAGFQAGEGCRILTGVHVYYPNRLRLGRNVGIAANCQLNAAAGIDVGDNVLIGPATMIWTQNHLYGDTGRPIASQGYRLAKVTIGDDVWIGAGCVILPGVHLAAGSVVAAGAVVLRSCEPYSVLAGVPAKVIDCRKANGHGFDSGATADDRSVRSVRNGSTEPPTQTTGH